MTTEDWTAPGVFEVVPGVHRIPLPLPNDGLRAVNVYAVVGDDGPVLIDSGWAITEARELLDNALRQLGTGAAEVRRFLITHVHRDHYSQAIHLRREFGTRVSLGAEERQSLEIAGRPGRTPDQSSQVKLLRELGAFEIAQSLANSMKSIPRDISDWELPDDWFTNHEQIDANGRSLEVVETPGHTRGHVVFYDNPNALLFAGDHVLPTITPSIGFEPALQTSPLGSFLESLAIVRNRPDAMLLPAHGSVTASAHKRVDELVEHHDNRLNAMLAALQYGETAAVVAANVTWTRREHSLADLDTFNKFLAVCETGAHLELLVAQGRATKEIRDDVRYYAAV